MATSTPAIKSVCLKTRPLVLLLIFINFISDGTCQDISLQCSLLQENSITQFNCTVRCAHYNVFFDFEGADKKSRTLCEVSSSSTCDRQSSGEMTCGCVLPDSGVKYYQLNFNGNKQYENGKLTCIANCFPVPDGAVCQPLNFGSGNSMHVWRTGIVVSMSGIIALISTRLS